MANKLAVYKQDFHNSNFEHFWEQMAVRNKSFLGSDELYVAYTLHQLRDAEYEGIIEYDDFMRLAYKNGVTKLGRDLPYARAESWRPSDETVMRWEPTKQSSDVLSLGEIDLHDC